MDPSIPKTVGDPHDPDSDPLETRESAEALDALIAACDSGIEALAT